MSSRLRPKRSELAGAASGGAGQFAEPEILEPRREQAKRDTINLTKRRQTAMPKVKTHSGAKKRFKLTKNGQVKRAHANKSHLLNGHGKTRKLKRGLRKAGYADVTNAPTIKRMIPYK